MAAHDLADMRPGQRPRIVVLDGHTLVPRPDAAGEVTWDAVAGMGDLTVYDRSPRDGIVERADGAEVVLTNKAPLFGDVLERLPALRYIGVTATGTNIVDLDAARQHGVTVTNVPGYGADSVAQHAVALLLALASRVAEHDRAVHDGQWQRCPDFSFTVAPIVELAGKTLGIVGMGAIGCRVAQIGAALGMRIAAAHQRSMDRVEVEGVTIDWHPVDEVFRTADVVTLHCPLTDQTHHLVSAERLASMKPSAFLINTGRGPLVDETALAAALRERTIAGAALDVLSMEPPPDGHPLLAAPRCVITPHCAWASLEARRRLMSITVENLRSFLGGHPVHVVNG